MEETPGNSKTFTSPFEHFVKTSKTSAKCQKCQKILKIPNYGTHGLIKHLERIHGMTKASIDESSQTKNVQPTKKQKTLDSFVKVEKPSFSSYLAELVCKDGFAINQIQTSRALIELFNKCGFEVPKTHRTMSTLVHSEADKIRIEMTKEIEGMKQRKEKFSFSVDEATTKAKYRILNVHLYSSSKNFNLGMVLVPKTCPAETLLELTSERLKRFNLSLQNDTIGLTTDGASVCKKFGTLTGKIHQLCYDHAIHLAVIKTVYKHNEPEVLSEVLQVVKETMAVISKESADLLDAEGAFEFLFEELKSTDGSFSNNLLCSLQDEIKKRRNKNLVSLMKFLQNPGSLNAPIDNFFVMSSMKDIIKEASTIWKDFFNVDTPTEVGGQEMEVVPGQSVLSLREKLGMKIGSRKETATQVVNHGSRFIKTACETYAATKAMPECLKKIQEALLVIKPTSIRNEENFSASSNFLTDKRTSLTCRSLDDYCFLKSYYIQKQTL